MQGSVQVNAIGNRSAIRDVNDIGQRVSYANKVTLRGSISELANFLDQKIHTKPCQVSRNYRSGPRSTRQTKSLVKMPDRQHRIRQPTNTAVSKTSGIIPPRHALKPRNRRLRDLSPGALRRRRGCAWICAHSPLTLAGSAAADARLTRRHEDTVPQKMLTTTATRRIFPLCPRSHDRPAERHAGR
jgi:hypothetical protein